mmetsp:Transcript_10964/g.45673  ORF Transcript_10964/g.45673 Transcript_10964/m.45673 type:complete len:391 (+) Transcript_10964:714-1886(+)
MIVVEQKLPSLPSIAADKLPSSRVSVAISIPFLRLKSSRLRILPGKCASKCPSARRPPRPRSPLESTYSFRTVRLIRAWVSCNSASVRTLENSTLTPLPPSTLVPARSESARSASDSRGARSSVASRRRISICIAASTASIFQSAASSASAGTRSLAPSSPSSPPSPPPPPSSSSLFRKKCIIVLGSRVALAAHRGSTSVGASTLTLDAPGDSNPPDPDTAASPPAPPALDADAFRSRSTRAFSSARSWFRNHSCTMRSLTSGSKSSGYRMPTTLVPSSATTFTARIPRSLLLKRCSCLSSVFSSAPHAGTTAPERMQHRTCREPAVHSRPAPSRDTAHDAPCMHPRSVNSYVCAHGCDAASSSWSSYLRYLVSSSSTSISKKLAPVFGL